MTDLAALMSSPEGRALLVRHGVNLDAESFLAAASVGATPPRLFVHQQPCPDFAPSVIAKFAFLQHLAQRFACVAGYVAIDTDRAASSRIATRIAWHGADGRSSSFKLTPAGTRHMEFRHILTDPARLAEAERRLSLAAGAACRDRLRDVSPILAPPEPLRYGDYGVQLGRFLLARSIGLTPETCFVSALQRHPLVRAQIAAFLEVRGSFIAAFNAKLAAFQFIGLETGLRPLPEGYLPFFHSCPVDGERTRLLMSDAPGSRHAVTETRAGRRYRLACDALCDSERVSLDVMLPVFLNPLYDGLVAGRSSALYCMVMGHAMEKSMGQHLMPLVVPASLSGPQADPRGLMQRWLEGGAR